LIENDVITIVEVEAEAEMIEAEPHHHAIVIVEKVEIVNFIQQKSPISICGDE
jgi:hypothetical protein